MIRAAIAALVLSLLAAVLTLTTAVYLVLAG